MRWILVALALAACEAESVEQAAQADAEALFDPSPPPAASVCGDAQIGVTSPTGDAGVFVELNGVLRATMAQGALSARAAMPAPFIGVDLHFGADVGRGFCSGAMVWPQPGPRQVWRMVGGRVEVRSRMLPIAALPTAEVAVTLIDPVFTTGGPAGPGMAMAGVFALPAVQVNGTFPP